MPRIHMTLTSLKPFSKVVTSVAMAVALFGCIDDRMAPTDRTMIQFVNAIDGSRNLRLSLNSVLAAPPLDYRRYGGCREQNPGIYTATLHTTDGNTTLVTLPDVTIEEKQKYTVVASGTLAEPYLTVLHDEYPRPKRGRSKVRPYNALLNVGELDMYITGEGEKMGASNSSRVAFNADREFVDAPAIRSRVQFTRTGDQKVIAYDGPVDLTDRGARTVFIAGYPAKTFVVFMCI